MHLLTNIMILFCPSDSEDVNQAKSALFLGTHPLLIALKEGLRVQHLFSYSGVKIQRGYKVFWHIMPRPQMSPRPDSRGARLELLAHICIFHFVDPIIHQKLQ